MIAKAGIDVGTETFSDVVYADDTVLSVTSAERATECLSSFQQSVRTFGLHIFRPNTKIQNLGADQSFLNVVRDGNLVDRVDGFIYLVAFSP